MPSAVSSFLSPDGAEQALSDFGFNVSDVATVAARGAISGLGLNISLTPAQERAIGDQAEENEESAISSFFPATRNLFKVTEEFIVLDEIETPDGKWPNTFGNVMVISVQDAERLLKRQIRQVRNALDFASPGNQNQQLLKTLRDAQRNFKLSDYAMEIDVMYKYHTDAYTGSSKNMKGHLSRFNNAIINALSTIPGNNRTKRYVEL